MVSTVFEPLVVGMARTGALDISLSTRRVISVPTQLGCNVGCSFCVSSNSPSTTNLSASDMTSVVESCFAARPADAMPVELSFTGEGEALVNLQAVKLAACELAAAYPSIDSLRISTSGLGAASLLPRVDGFPLPVRLQFSLHAARQQIRQDMVPRSQPLDVVLPALRENQARFAGVELNVVLQEGINDSEEDLKALAAWGEREWPILLSPLLTDGLEVVASRTARFESELRAAGRDVRRYATVAASISRSGLYPLMTASRRQIHIRSAPSLARRPDRLAA